MESGQIGQNGAGALSLVEVDLYSEIEPVLDLSMGVWNAVDQIWKCKTAAFSVQVRLLTKSMFIDSLILTPVFRI